MENPVDEELRNEISTKFASEFAIALHDLKGWPLVGLTANGSDWVYLAVRTPDNLILDVNDFSANGQHIIDDDRIYEMIPAADFVDDGNAWFIPVSYDEACEYVETSVKDYPQEVLEKTAKEVLDWYSS